MATTKTKPIGREFIECDAPGCGKSNPGSRCSKCHTVFYCDRTCQRRGWRDHKPDCRDIEWMRQQQLAFMAGSDADPVPGNTDADEEAAEPSPSAEASCCVICLAEPISDPFVLPACKHAFCFNCIRQWQDFVKRPVSMDSPQQLNCPQCRVDAPDIEKSANETAMLYASRANRAGLDEAKEKEYRELALAELDRMKDTNNMQTLFSKVEVLFALERPDDALEVLERLADIDEEGRKNAAFIDDMLAKSNIAMAEGREEDAERILTQLEGDSRTRNCQRMHNNGYDMYIKMAEAKEMQQDWDGALKVYIGKMMATMSDESARGTPPQERMMYMGISRCSYHLGDYEKAIYAGEAAIEMNRHFPQVHKYVALAQKASGDLEAARRTMARAVNYEAPWDEHNKKEVMRMYEELMKKEF